MNILVADDDARKCDQVARHIRTLAAELSAAVTVVTTESYGAALRFCVDSRPDLLILDMTMPTFTVGPGEPGGRPRHFAGRDILRELVRRRLLIPAIICTGFDVIGEGPEQCTRSELAGELETEFPEAYLGMVFFTTSDSAWKSELSRLVSSVMTGSEWRQF